VKVSPACGKNSSGRVTSAGRALRLPETLEYLARQVARDCMDEARAVRVRKHWRERRPAIRCCHLRPDRTGLRRTLRSCAAVGQRGDMPRAHHGTVREDVHGRARQG
jgi:hypothetical protein